MIMLLWRVSGGHSKVSLFITVVTRQERRPFERSPNTSRSFTIGKEGKQGWGTYPRLTMSGSSMQGRLQHERRFRVHYCHRGSMVRGLVLAEVRSFIVEHCED